MPPVELLLWSFLHPLLAFLAGLDHDSSANSCRLEQTGTQARQGLRLFRSVTLLGFARSEALPCQVDKVMLSQDWLVVQAPAVQDTVAVESSEPSPLPACTQEHELIDNVHGRWVKLPWPNETECLLQSFDPERPQCWHRDDLSGIGYGCGESNCRSIWPDSRWESSLQEKKFNAAWHNHGCDYVEFTNAQLNECLATKKIAKFKFAGASIAKQFAGASIAKQLEDTMKRLLLQLELSNASEPDAITVTFGTFGILHWSIQPTAANRKQLQAVKHVDPAKEIKIIVNGYYLNSKRQTHCHADYSSTSGE